MLCAAPDSNVCWLSYTEPSRSSARFYIGALCNSAIKLAAPKRWGRSFFVYALIQRCRKRGPGSGKSLQICEARVSIMRRPF